MNFKPEILSSASIQNIFAKPRKKLLPNVQKCKSLTAVLNICKRFWSKNLEKLQNTTGRPTKFKNKITDLQRFPGQCDVTGNEKAGAFGKRVTLITHITESQASYGTVKSTTRRVFKIMSSQRLVIRTSQNPWKDPVAHTSD